MDKKKEHVIIVTFLVVLGMYLFYSVFSSHKQQNKISNLNEGISKLTHQHNILDSRYKIILSKYSKLKQFNHTTAQNIINSTNNIDKYDNAIKLDNVDIKLKTHQLPSDSELQALKKYHYPSEKNVKSMETVNAQQIDKVPYTTLFPSPTQKLATGVNSTPNIIGVHTTPHATGVHTTPHATGVHTTPHATGVHTTPHPTGVHRSELSDDTKFVTTPSDSHPFISNSDNPLEVPLRNKPKMFLYKPNPPNSVRRIIYDN